jgi:hypothetical protein
VAGERGFDADRHGFPVAHFTDHDHVRVGAQEGAHHGREIEPGLLVDLHLTQAFLGDFDRVLGGPDLGFRPVDVAEDRVQGGRLSRSGRAADEEQPVGPGDQGLQSLEVVLRDTEIRERDRFAGGEDA